MVVVGCSDLPEDHSSVLLLGVNKLQTSPVPCRRPFSLPAAIDTGNQYNFSNSEQSTRSSCSPRIIITDNSSQECNANNIVTNQELSIHDAWDDELSVDGDSPAINVKITHPFFNSADLIGHPLMDKSMDSIGTCSLDVEVSVDVPGRFCVVLYYRRLTFSSNSLYKNFNQ